MSNDTETLSGGGSRRDLRPHRPDGTRHDGMRGHHRRRQASLNIRNPQPGWHYHWARRDDDTVIPLCNEGWMAVKPTDPEFSGASLPSEVSKALSSGTQAHQDVVLLKIREQKYAEIRALKQEDNAARRDGAGQGFMEHQSTYAGSEPLRYQKKKDSVEFETGPRRR